MTFVAKKDISFFEDEDTVLGNVKMAIKCPKPRFYPNKSYGARITSAVDENKLLARASCACEGLDGVYIKSAKINDGKITYSVLINDNERSVSIDFE